MLLSCAVLELGGKFKMRRGSLSTFAWNGVCVCVEWVFTVFTYFAFKFSHGVQPHFVVVYAGWKIKKLTSPLCRLVSTIFRYWRFLPEFQSNGHCGTSFLF